MENFSASFKHVEPIPITKELLESVGFDNRGNEEYFIELKRPDKNFPIMFSYSIPEEDIRISSNGDYFKIKGFHHLQNIIYDLTGKELSLTEKIK